MKQIQRIAVIAILLTVTAEAQDRQIGELPGAAAFADRIRRQNAPGNTRLEAVRVDQPVRAAFVIEPLVHRVSARRGQLLKFQFKIAANLKATRLAIRPVAMVQKESGTILPDTEAVAPDVLRISSPATVSLALGEAHMIECEMRVPPVNSPFLSYGVLVRELPSDDDDTDGDSKRPAIGVRFLTQYLLRVDLEIVGVTGDSVTNLEVEQGRLVAKDGQAYIQAAINNPTDTPMTFGVRSRLVSLETGKTYRSDLWMPARSGVQKPDRFDSRILGQTRLLMVGELEDSVFPGSYSLILEATHHGRVYRKAEFPVEIRSGDFPAQDATIVRVGRDISVEPPHVELSLRRGGKRLQSLTIENGSQQNVIVDLTPQPFLGDLHEWISFRPETLELAPGRKRKVLVMLGNKRSFETHSYAFARLTVRPETGQALGAQDIPVALLTNNEATAEISAGALEWKIQSNQAGFEVPIQNAGGRHLELSGTLDLRDQFGRGFKIADGYGRWVLPGHKDRLWFALPQLPPPGIYEVQVNVEQGDDRPPFELRQNVRLKSALEKLSERNSQGRTQ